MTLSPAVHCYTPLLACYMQVGFFSIVVIPMYRALVTAFEDARPVLDGVMANYKRWEAAAASGKDPRK